MIRKILFSMSLLASGLCIAAPLTPEEALQRLQNDDLQPATRAVATPLPAYSLSTLKGEPSLYVFKKQDIAGFMVVSADDAVTPLLGYSDQPFDPENISPALSYWLNEYNRQIEYARNNPEVGAITENAITLPAWAPIAPMIKTKWNQNAPYYNMCPKVGSENCNTGCVATSMSQVMKYFNYPEKGQGRVSYKCSNDQINKVLSLDFSTLTFDWDNMLNSYNGDYTQKEADAVATLMMAAGYSVQMNYTTGTSGAVSGLINGALVNNFGYDPSAYYAVRELYTYSDWAALIYNNLKNIGPVIYDGNGFSYDGKGNVSDKVSGHSFICDGYQGDGYFHFNWGWGGSGDGYFLLDALNPSSIGIGGANGGFNYNQDCVLNIQKPTGKEVEEQSMLIMYGSSEGYLNGSTLYLSLTGSNILGWSYKGLGEIILDLGAIIEPQGDSSAQTLYVTSTNPYTVEQLLDPMGYIPLVYNGINTRPRFDLKNVNLAKGVKYKVTQAYLPEKTTKWLPIEAGVGSYNYFYITKIGDGFTADDYKIENLYPLQLSCKELTFDSKLYNGISVEVTATLANDTDTELTRGVTLQLFDESGKLRYVGDSFVISLAPGQTLTQSWISTLTAQTTTTVARALELYAALFDPETNTEYYRSSSTFTMSPNPGRPLYDTSLTIENAQMSDNKYQVETSADFNVNFTLDVTRNIFSYPVELWVASAQGNTYYKLLSYPLAPMIVGANELYEASINVSYPDAVVGNTYYIVSLVNGSYDNSIQFVAHSNQAGIEDIEMSSEAPVIFYDNATNKAYVKGNGLRSIDTYSTNGMKLSPKVEINGDSATLDLSTLGKGIVVVNVVDGNGNRKSAKIAL